VLIGSTEWMAQLAEDEMIRPLGNEIEPGELSAFVPSAVGAVHYAGRLYAYPQSVDSLALFYNPTLIPSPAKTLHELLLQVNSERGFAMPLDFFYAYWGLAAFGSRMFADIDLDRGIQADDGARAWLEWLREAARRPGFAFTVGRAEAEHMFIEHEAAYLVSGPWSLARLHAELPPEEIAVALLPSGPRDRAAPLLEVEGFMFNRSASPGAFAGGLAFARFVASAHSAEALLATGLQVPANVTVDLNSMPVMDELIDQAQLAQGVAQDNTWKRLARLGNELFRSVVMGDADVDEALDSFTQAVNLALATPGED
jgi:arabinogalactan oligomer/maltooligosaccharide transport system substrate-binding protein